MSDNPRCPHCGSTRIVRDDYKHAPAVKCQICGFRHELVMTPVKPMDVKSWRKNAKTREDLKKPCPVIGCNNLMAAYSTKEMCAACHKQLAAWEISTRMNPAPIERLPDGKWTLSKWEFKKRQMRRDAA